MKKLINGIICLCIVCTIFINSPVKTAAAGAPYVTHSFPKTMKLGDSLKDLSDPTVHYHNLIPGNSVMLAEFDYTVLNKIAMSDHCGDGPILKTVDKQGNADSREISAFFNVFYRPGTLIYQPKYYYTDDLEAPFDKAVPVGNPIRITIEAPLIAHNAPQTIKTGSSFTLNTALTNIGVSNQKVSEYTEEIAHDNDMSYMPNNYSKIHVLAYRPVVKIIQGADIVNQSKQDYTNTLTTSETLTFRKAGTVKLKVTYRQINTCGVCLDERYNPEKIITINVTDDGPVTTSSQPTTSTSLDTTTTVNNNPTSSMPTTNTSSIITSAPDTSSSISDTTVPAGSLVDITDEDTGIKLEANPNVIPPDTVIKAEPVTEGGNFVIINNALEQTSDKWVAYDISLLSNGMGIQPNGKVKITMPRPQGLNMNKMVLYHVAEDGTLTQIPFTLDDNKKNLIFETNHFSLYAVAENVAADDTIADNQEPKNSSPVLWIVLSVVGVVVLAGVGVALWYFKFRKKTTENE